MSVEPDDYDEFAMLGDNAAEAGLTLSTLPPVTRTSVTLAGPLPLAPAFLARDVSWRHS
jgi:hypothetical protein